MRKRPYYYVIALVLSLVSGASVATVTYYYCENKTVTMLAFPFYTVIFLFLTFPLLDLCFRNRRLYVNDQEIRNQKIDLCVEKRAVMSNIKPLVLPVVYLLLYPILFYVFRTWNLIVVSDRFSNLFVVLWGLFFFTWLLDLLFMTFLSIRRLFKLPISSSRRIILGILIITLGAIVIPVFYFFKVGSFMKE